MTDERRYRDDEAREILDRAIGQADASAPARQTVEGLSLRELQEVAREVGVPAQRVSEAAAALELRTAALPSESLLGMPTSVGYAVPLPRNPTDLEWERLVAELRTTFGAAGTVRVQGSSREWFHGSLHAFIEPTDQGYRLRLVDTRTAALGGALAFGGIMLAFALMIFLVLLGKGGPSAKMFVPLFFALGGGGLMTVSLASLPGWLRKQRARMEQVCTRALTLLKS